MIYVRDVARALEFYQGVLGLNTIDILQAGPRPVYARLQSSVGTTTIALHQVGPGQGLPAFDGMRLYFEVKELNAFCKRLQAEGAEITQMPKPMAVGMDPPLAE